MRFRATVRRATEQRGCDPYVWRPPGDSRAAADAQLDARVQVRRSINALGGPESPAASCLLHVVGCDRSIREWAAKIGWRGPVDRRQAVGYLVAGLAILAARDGRG